MPIRWNDHPSGLRATAAALGLPECGPADMFHGVHLILGATRGGPGFTTMMVQFQGEARWMIAGRPFYNLWPSVIEAFTRVDLTRVDCSEVSLPLCQLMIRLPVGREFHRIRTIFVTEALARSSERGILMAVNDGTYLEGIPVPTVTCFDLERGLSIQEKLDWCHNNPFVQNDEIDGDLVNIATRLVVTICLLRNQPDLVQPVPLNADAERYEISFDPSLIERAVRRGKREWDIGRHVEVAPGFRRPHFAIRHMGRGDEPKRAVLRPIRGCIVHREKILDVPTDWLDQIEGPPVPVK